jgi:hypothetical protein
MLMLPYDLKDLWYNLNDISNFPILESKKKKKKKEIRIRFT